MLMLYREWAASGIVLSWFLGNHFGNSFVTGGFLVISTLSFLMICSTLTRFFINLRKGADSGAL